MTATKHVPIAEFDDLDDDHRDLLRVADAMVEMAEHVGRKLTVKCGGASLRATGKGARLKVDGEWCDVIVQDDPDPEARS